MEHDHDHDHDDMEGMEGMEDFDGEPMEGEPMAQTFFFGMDTAQGFVTYVTPPESCTLKLTSVALPKKIAEGTMVRIFAKSVPLEEGEDEEEEGEDKKEEEGEDKADEEDDLKNAFCICVLKAGHEEFKQIDLTLSSGEKLKMIVEADTEDKKEEITIHIAGYYTLENYPEYDDEDEDDEIPLGEVEDDNSEDVSDDEQALYKKLAQGEDMAEEDEEDQSFVFQEKEDAEEDAEAEKQLVAEEPVEQKKSKKEKKQEKKQAKKEEKKAAKEEPKKEEPKKEEKKPEAAKPAEKKTKAEKKAEKRKREEEAAPAPAQPAEKKQKQEDGQGKKKKNKKNKKNKKQKEQ